MLSFERGKSVTDSLDIGRAKAAWRVKQTYLKVVIFQEDPYCPGPNIGRYFRNDLEQEYEIKPSVAYVLITLARKKEYEKLEKILKSFLEEVPSSAVAHFTFIFEGEEGSQFPRPYDAHKGKYFWKDVAGLDLVVDNKIVDVPEGRLIKNSDFQFHLPGLEGPGRPTQRV